MTSEQFAKCFPNAKEPEEWTEAINDFTELYNVENLAAFLAQCGHESTGFCRTIENLNYSAEALRATWPHRFTNDEIAAEYARQPEKIANKVYSDRLGNGDAASGDGWRFRGAGCIQLTGRANHAAFAKAINNTLEEATEYLHTIRGAVESAAWFWDTKDLNRWVNDFDTLSRRINGGDNGRAERRALYAKVQKVLEV